jgi:hypothetical protein
VRDFYVEMEERTRLRRLQRLTVTIRPYCRRSIRVCARILGGQLAAQELVHQVRRRKRDQDGDGDEERHKRPFALREWLAGGSRGPPPPALRYFFFAALFRAGLRAVRDFAAAARIGRFAVLRAVFFAAGRLAAFFAAGRFTAFLAAFFAAGLFAADFLAGAIFPASCLP